ncbi:MAG: conjugal transfer protein TraG, partial [Mesorhizobium sp.]
DQNFTERVLPSPVLQDGTYADRPASRPDDWSGQVRSVDRRLAADDESAGAAIEDDGGVQQQRHPGLPEEHSVVAQEPDESDLLNPADDDSEAAADKRVMDRISIAARAYGINEGMGDDKDIVPGF